MKRAAFYIGIIVLAAGILSSAYYISYKKTLENYQEEQRAKNEEQSKLVEQTDHLLAAETKDDLTKTDPSVAADTVKEDRITDKTEYVLVRYDLKMNQVIEDNKQVPAGLIGMNRQEVVNYLTEYMKDISLDELRAGLVSYELQAFSTDRVVLQKTYDPDRMPYEYYIGLQNYEVVVYYCDKETIFEYTGIDARALSEDDQYQLLDGIFVTDQEELYGILENYSS